MPCKQDDLYDSYERCDLHLRYTFCFVLSPSLPRIMTQQKCTASKIATTTAPGVVPQGSTLSESAGKVAYGFVMWVVTESIVSV